MNLDLMTYVALGSIISIVFAYIMFNRVKSQPMGTDKMKKLSEYIQTGANAYLKRQYKGVGLFFSVIFIVLLVLGVLMYVLIITLRPKFQKRALTQFKNNI